MTSYCCKVDLCDREAMFMRNSIEKNLTHTRTYLHESFRVVTGPLIKIAPVVKAPDTWERWNSRDAA